LILNSLLSNLGVYIKKFAQTQLMAYNYRKLKNSPFRFVFHGFFITAVLVILAFVFVEQRKQKAHAAFFAAENFRMKVFELASSFPEFMKTERSDNFFLYDYDAKSEEIALQIERLYQAVNNKDLADAVVEAGIRNNSSDLKILTEKFNTNFQNILSAEKTLGNDEYGLAQSLKDAGAQLKLRAEMLPDSLLRRRLSNLSELAEAYQKNPLEATERDYLKRSEALINKLKPPKDGEPSADEKKRMDILLKHRLRFIAYSKAVSVLGRTPQDGLKAAAFESLRELTQISDTYYRYQLDNFKKQTKRSRINIFIAIGLSLLVPLILLFWIYRKITGYFDKIEILLQYLKEGEITRFDYSRSISSFPMLRTIRDIFSGLEFKNKHIQKISSGVAGDGEYRYDLYDVLGQSILELEESVLRSQKEKEHELEKKELEDRRIRGLTKFAAVMRENAGQAQNMAQAVTNELVNFLNIEMGGFYILKPEKDPPEYELIAAYAYNQEKRIQKNVSIGKGLVGTAASDKISFHYDELPEDYLSIVTGFGQAPPKALYIQPLISGNTVVGVLELASIGKFSQYDIEFIESLAGDIASALRYIILEKA
jgi:putative methionine-R-sulfoxide reductase with GAF domain